MTLFSMTSSCILGFKARQLVSYRLGLILIILCFLYDGKSQSISEENNSGLQTQQWPIRQVAGNPCRRRFNSEKNGDLNLNESSEEDDIGVHRAAVVKPESEYKRK